MDPIVKMAETFKVLSDKSRLTILALLNEKELCVCEIVELLEMSQPSISQHLRKLKSDGLVSERRRGQWIYYNLHEDVPKYVKDILPYLPDQKKNIKKLDQLNINTYC